MILYCNRTCLQYNFGTYSGVLRARGLFICRCVMEEKTFKNYNEMLVLLSSRGIDLSNPELKGRAKRYIQHEGYYNLINGYKRPFLVVDEVGLPVVPERYLDGTTVDEIYALYAFDRKLRSICLSNILHIETNIKNLIAYEFSEKHGHKNYLTIRNFDTSNGNSVTNITALFSNIQNQISSRCSDPSIQHYLNNHGYVPLWVLNNILTFGDVSKFYSLMKQPERQAISKIFKIQDNELASILTYLSSVRNICAHDNRLYCFRTKRPISDMPVHKSLGVPRGQGEYKYGKRDLFALMLIFYVMLPKVRFKAIVKQINRALFSLKSSLVVLNEADILQYMGFPTDWKSKLLGKEVHRCLEKSVLLEP